MLYGDEGERWAMTEYPREQVQRSADALQIGPNRIAWEGDELLVTFDERAPWSRRPLRGSVRLRPAALTSTSIELDANGRHTWWPVAPHARAEVDLTSHDLRFSAAAYHDANSGEEPLEAAFRSWNWSRATLPFGTAVTYDVVDRQGTERPLTLLFDEFGDGHPLTLPTVTELTRGHWGITRKTRADRRGSVGLKQDLEDTPFYTRSLLSTHVAGHPVTAVHESVDLERLARGWVLFLLPFRIRRG